jgi:NADH-quinone oxidoreductase subunit J
MSTIFYLSSLVAIASTIMVITRLNVAHALLYLLVSFFAVAIIFFALGAPFAGALEIVIYAGAIMVLFVFIIMMLNVGKIPDNAAKELLRPATWVGPSALALVLAAEMVYVFASGEWVAHTVIETTPKQVGAALFGPYLIAVELASVLLLAGLVAAYHLGRPEERKPSRGDRD